MDTSLSDDMNSQGALIDTFANASKFLSVNNVEIKEIANVTLNKNNTLLISHYSSYCSGKRLSYSNAILVTYISRIVVEYTNYSSSDLYSEISENLLESLQSEHFNDQLLQNLKNLNSTKCFSCLNTSLLLYGLEVFHELLSPSLSPTVLKEKPNVLSDIPSVPITLINIIIAAGCGLAICCILFYCMYKSIRASQKRVIVGVALD